MAFYNELIEINDFGNEKKKKNVFLTWVVLRFLGR